jgi:hypothetical protein
MSYCEEVRMDHPGTRAEYIDFWKKDFKYSLIDSITHNNGYNESKKKRSPEFMLFPDH